MRTSRDVLQSCSIASRTETCGQIHNCRNAQSSVIRNLLRGDAAMQTETPSNDLALTSSTKSFIQIHRSSPILYNSFSAINSYNLSSPPPHQTQEDVPQTISAASDKQPTSSHSAYQSTQISAQPLETNQPIPQSCK